MTEDERMALVMKVGAIVTCEGRALSAFNTCLVLNQLPTASMVGGSRQWKDKGRSVRKGEHGLMIWVPISKGEKTEDGVPVPATETGAEKEKRAGFINGTVFDISQTEPSKVCDGIDRQHLEERSQDRQTWAACRRSVARTPFPSAG